MAAGSFTRIISCVVPALAASVVASSLQSNTTQNPSNPRVPWGPFQNHGYVLFGDFDPNPAIVDPHLDIQYDLGEIILEMRETAAQGQVQTFYEGTDGGTKIVITWFTAMGHDGCVNVIQSLGAVLRTHNDINTHPMLAFITKNEQNQARISVTSEHGEPVDINLDHALQLEADYWPGRTIDPRETGTAISTIRNNATHYDQDSYIPFEQYNEYVGNTNMIVGIDEGIKIKFGDLVQMLDALGGFYLRHPIAEIYAQMILNDGDPVGFLIIAARENVHMVTLANSTAEISMF